MNGKYIPPIAVHPGKTLLETIEALNMCQNDLAERSGLHSKTVNEIIQCKAPITPDTAVKLSAVFGTSVSFWNILQRTYEDALANQKQVAILEKEAPLLKEFPCYHELERWGYITTAKTRQMKVFRLLNFFAVSSLEIVRDVKAIAFRKSSHAQFNPYCLAAWLRCGEIDAKKSILKPFNEVKLKSYLPEFRKLTKERPEVFAKELTNKCAECGIAVVFVPHFKGTSANGATTWLTPEHALIQLSVRYKWEDVFWFTFFHEIGHILLHGKKDQFVEIGSSVEPKEREADMFAQKMLIPENEYQRFLQRKVYSSSEIQAFATRVGVSTAIIAGRLSHDTNNWVRWAKLRGKYDIVRKD